MAILTGRRCPDSTLGLSDYVSLTTRSHYQMAIWTGDSDVQAPSPDSDSVIIMMLQIIGQWQIEQAVRASDAALHMLSGCR